MINKLYMFGAAAAVAGVILTGTYYKGRWDEDAEWQKKWDKKVTAAKEDADKLEKTYQDKITGVEKDAKSQISILRDDLDRASIAYNSLHDTARLYAARADKCAATSTTSNNRTSCTLLAHLFKEADTRAGALAETADRAIIAANTCEASYNVLRN